MFKQETSPCFKERDVCQYPRGSEKNLLACTLHFDTTPFINKHTNTQTTYRFSMWTGNDFLPGFENVGWATANKLHQQYEELCCENEKVYALLFIFMFVCNGHVVDTDNNTQTVCLYSGIFFD